MNTTLKAPQGEFELYRLPMRKQELLQAWDAADEYILSHISTDVDLSTRSSIVIVNDSFGALTVALAENPVCMISDSYLSHQACLKNLYKNNISTEHIQLLNSLELPEHPVGLLIVKIPKTLALLEYQLIQLRPLLDSKSTIIFAGMIKQLSPNVWKHVERIIGPTTTSLARKKARLIFAQVDKNLPIVVNPYPKTFVLENTHDVISNHANVFSRESLDIGTRFFLQNLPPFTDKQDIIDLGCGNGVVGLMVAKQSTDATIHFVDESYMAIASARDNFLRAYNNDHKATYIVGNSLDDFSNESTDVILCNPPFHQHHVVGDYLAMLMFKQSARVLRKGGQLWVVGNRHLQYHTKLKQFFKHVRLIGGNKKFVIIQAVC